MELTTTQMYWLVMLDSITSGIVAILIISWLFFLLIGIPMVIVTEEKKLFFKLAKTFLIIVAASILCLMFIPSTKQMAAILIVPRLANCEKVQTIGNKVYDLAVEWMEELKPNQKERVNND